VGCELAARERDRFEARVDSECAQQVPDVIPHRLLAQVELFRDLPVERPRSSSASTSA
jgi:hypothetical protein